MESRAKSARLPLSRRLRNALAGLDCKEPFVMVLSRSKAIRRDNVLALGSPRKIHPPDPLTLVFIGGYLLRHCARTTDKFLLDHMGAPLRTFCFFGQLKA